MTKDTAIALIIFVNVNLCKLDIVSHGTKKFNSNHERHFLSQSLAGEGIIFVWRVPAISNSVDQIQVRTGANLLR